LQKKETKTSDSTNHFFLNRTLIALFAIVALLANFFNIKKMHHTDSTEKTASFKVGVKLSLKKFLKKILKIFIFLILIY
jgi:Na+/melibiose symporter-like transporter